MARDRFHNQVKAALIKDLWSITHDPFSIQISDFFQLPFIQKSLKRHTVNLVIYDPIKTEIKQWINFNNTNK
ncbi:MAG: hypothetical protein H0X31_07865 [Nostocaceae cyanobacterium]|nr:hypothetical protein [Nostocaceae cyanobacterium]